LIVLIMYVLFWLSYARSIPSANSMEKGNIYIELICWYKIAGPLI
jgi:hypothetical protein